MSDVGIQQETEPQVTVAAMVEAVKRKAKTRKGSPRKAVKKATTRSKPSTQRLPPQTLLQSPQSTSQPRPPQPVLQPQQTVVQPLQTLFQPLQTVLQPRQNILPLPQQAVLHPLHTVPLHPQTVHQPPLLPKPQPGSTENNPPQASVVQFTSLPSGFSSPMLNSTLQTPIQHAVPSSLSSTQTHSETSTMSLLNALHDEKLGLLLPVMVKMDHKIDQLMALVGQLGNQLNSVVMAINQSNASLMVNQSNPAVMGNQSNASMSGNQSNAARMENQSNASIVGNQSNVTVQNQSNASKMGNHSNAVIVESQSNPSVGSQSNAVMTGTQKSAAIAITNPINIPFLNSGKQTPQDVSVIAPKSDPTAVETRTSLSSIIMETRSNANVASEFHLNDGMMENQGDTMMETELGTETATSGDSDTSPGMMATRSQQGKNQTDDLNFPISQEQINFLKAKSTSFMNFAVQLLRALFKMEELEGKNISGSRGKDKVDPKRVEIIKQMVFKIYGTLPSDRDEVWRGCRKAMDSFLRNVKREKAMKEKAALQKTNLL